MNKKNNQKILGYGNNRKYTENGLLALYSMYCLPCAPVDHQLLGVSYTLAFRAVSFLYFDALFKLCHPFMFTISYIMIKKKWTIPFFFQKFDFSFYSEVD